MKTDDIRSTFLEFFRQRDHVVEKSDRVVPSGDPTLLFTSAGMVQFKPYYTGEVPLPYRRAATSQKCLRAGGKANDLDEVGKTSRHMTFFEMLGNFSFGDYFKQEAIAWAWELATDKLGFAAEAIVVSVYEDDDEAAGIWESEAGVPRDRIIPMGAKDNFWGPAGETGACGPCSELHLDRGESIDPGATLENDPRERFIEFYNLVFPQFDQQEDGSRPPLKNRGIDTGMGLERVAALSQGVETVYDTDGIMPIIEAAQSMATTPYAKAPVPYRVIADHARALSFMIADGILPGNEGRGYVQRRLLRRAARFGREIGLERPFLYEVAPAVIERMSHQFPELQERRAQITKVIQTEEERFQSTLARGMDLLEEIFTGLEEQGAQTVPGDELFKLHDTFGFPLDLATDIAEDRGYAIDRTGFEAAMAEQRERARGAWSGSGEEAIPAVYRTVSEDTGDTEFVGYAAGEASATVQALVREGNQVESLGAGETGEAVLDVTPFYAEAGGQVADIGTLEAPGATATVDGVTAPLGKSVFHKVTVKDGAIRVGDSVVARIDAARRAKIARHHTATHLLQAALQEVVGDHVNQAGSLVTDSRLRFDFTHFEAIPQERLRDIEALVNEYIRQDAPVHWETMPIEQAREKGAMALFGEKYGDVVRVVSAGDISLELCGGTHVERTGTIGTFKVVSESSISAGVRRIEAVCGEPAIAYVQDRERQLLAASQLLNASPETLADRITQLQEENKRLNREVEKWKQQAATGGGTDYTDQIQDVDGVKLLAIEAPGQDNKGLRLVMDKLRDRLPSGVIVLGGSSEGKAALCVAVSKDLVSRVKAGDIVKELAPIVGGGGGGRPDMAQAGGKEPDKLPEAIGKAPEVVRGLLG